MQPRVPKRTPRKAGRNIGVSGVHVFAGQYQDIDINSCLRGNLKFKEYHNMYDDTTVASIVSAIALPITSAEWAVVPSVDEPSPLEEQIAYDLQQDLFNMQYITWKEFVNQAVRCVFEGITIFEKIWKLDEGRVKPVNLAVRLPSSVEKWLTDPKGKPTGIYQNVWGDAGFVGEIPIDKLVLFTYDGVGNDPVGRGLFRKIFRAYLIKKDVENISVLGAERAATGVPVINNANQGDTDQYIKFLQDFVQAQQPYAVFPEGIEFNLTDVRGSDNSSLLMHFTNAMRGAALSQFISIGEDGVGSRALSEDQTSFFLESLNAAAEIIRSGIQTQLIRQYMKWNYPPDTAEPKLMFRIDKRNVTEIMTNITKAIASGALTVTTDIESTIRELLDLQPFAEENVIETEDEGDDDAESS